MLNQITVEIVTKKSVSDAWDVFTNPVFIIQWNFASKDWHCPKAVNNLFENGIFNYRMESIDGKYGFDFSGKYVKVDQYKEIIYKLGDTRIVKVEFLEVNKEVIVRETFDAETENPIELQRNGWQSILSNYKSILDKI
jgi:uncharacterized protein YndB with AHSA1/START domain